MTCRTRSAKFRSIEIAEANGVRSPDFVAITRSDAALSRADRLAVLARAGLVQPVFFQVPGKDDMGSVGDHQVLADRDSASDQSVDLAEDARRVQDDAAGNDVLDPGIQDCRWE